jgi:hypothetical protein
VKFPIADYQGYAKTQIKYLQIGWNARDKAERNDAQLELPLEDTRYPGLRDAMVLLSRALGNHTFIDAAEGQCVEAALVEKAAKQIQELKEEMFK